MLFLIKKIITCFILPPGIFIILLLISLIFLRKRLRLFIIFITVLLYLSSIEPTKNILLTPLEYAFKPPSIEEIKRCDAYVVTGGGINESAPDISGEGILSEATLSRVFGAYRVYMIDKKPIIISGGKVLEKKAEADVAKRILISLGLSENDLIAESASKDTYENAKLVREICENKKFKKILLITNAYHMKRSLMLFKKHFKYVTPYPSGYMASKSDYNFLSFFPNESNIGAISIGLKEYLGILFYKITL